ncbi:MAG: hypothetical protein ACRDB0_06540 [Paraclostridium sp.]
MFKENLKTLERSNVKVFNEIGEMATNKGLEVVFFYDERFKVDYIHILQEQSLFISIYFDRFSKLALDMPPYYELYDLQDVYRYLLKEKEALIEKVGTYL